MPPAAVELHGVSKRYPGAVRALDGIDLSVAAGERLAVVGPSGSGKSTLLRLIAGLERADSGSIRLGGRPADRLSPVARDVALVFQNPAVYPHLDVLQNLAFGLRARGVRPAEARRRAEEVAGLLGLSDLLGRRPGALSGGQRQRVALGRALARRPAVLLLDEPFSALDVPLRAALRADLAMIQRRDGITMLHVTHDQGEALAIGDRLAVLEAGRVLQVDPPGLVYARPANPSVAAFVGDPPMNLVRIEWRAEADQVLLQLPGQDSAAVVSRNLPGAQALESPGQGVLLMGVRPERILTRRPAEFASIPLSGRVERIEIRGPDAVVVLALAPRISLVVELDRAAQLRSGELLQCYLPLNHLVWFPEHQKHQDKG